MLNSKREIRKVQPLIKKINSLRSKYINMSNSELMEASKELKNRYQIEKPDKILPDAFALVREASRRAIGKEHYDVQLISGIELYFGRISEAKTGEGKTITIYLPAFLESMSGKGVHVVTVNDYLANRDATEASKVFELLGVSVGCVLHDDTQEQRKEAYRCDITYVTNSELGFDYLKDNIAMNPDLLTLRDFNYAIIDEVDSILIDEAKTPLIISGPGPDSESLLRDVDNFVTKLSQGRLREYTATEKLLGAETSESGDFIINEKEKNIYLTERGIAKVEKHFKVSDYGSPETMSLQRAINNALRARYLMFLDKDYVVRDDKVEIVDSFTGRVLPGRRFSNGLHQSIETKENVTIQKENVTIATITFQSFFNKYKKKAGLTGTAITSAKEFKDVYNLDIVAIPTNKPVIREDRNDAVFATKDEKWNAVVSEVVEANKRGQPVLVGTTSISDSEYISNLLNRLHIVHNVLNAKNEAIEAEIIAEAGKYGAVTVATNMAGRGTDIMLDDDAKAAGGLYVIGTERHDSRRIDDQLKGRSGRQGDPGVSQFFISLEDRVMRVFADKSSLETLMMIASEPGQPIEYRPLTKIIEKAQAAIETEHRLIRENLLKYDETNNEHREQIYAQRRDILLSEDPKSLLIGMFNDVSDEIINKYIADHVSNNEWDLNAAFNEYFDRVAYVNIQIDKNGMSKPDLLKAFHKMNALLVDMKEQQIGNKDIALDVERNVMLKFIDRNWVAFLNSMEYVKANIGMQSYGQKDPVAEYQKRGVELFNTMIDNIEKDAVLNFMRCVIRINTPDQDQNIDNE